ncbi:MAG: MFS transporter [Gemmatimonadales bacterium]|nr:MFS transporter [Gemmatimonadales bacterium]
MLPALANRNFRLFLAGQFVSLIGSLMQSVAIGWLVLDLTDSPLTVGVVQGLGAAPILLLGLVGGVWADRLDRRAALLVFQALFMLEAAFLTGLTATGHATVGWVAAAAIFGGVVSAVEIPTRQSFVHDIVGEVHLVQAVALTSTAFNLARVLGPALGGVLIAAAGFTWCFALNTLSFVAVLWALSRVRVAPGGAGREHPGVADALREGVAFLGDSPAARAIVVLSGVLTVFGFQFVTMLPVLARDVLHLQSSGYGGLVASVGVGAATGALSLGVRRSSGGPRLVPLSGVAFGLLLAAASFAPTPAAAMLGFTAVGMSMAGNGIASNSWLQRLAPDALRGRVLGFYAFAVLGLAPVGALLFGWAAEQFGARHALALGGGVCAVVSLGVLWGGVLGGRPAAPPARAGAGGAAGRGAQAKSSPPAFP